VTASASDSELLLYLRALYTQLYFTKKLVAHNNLKKKRKGKQQYKQDDNHLVTNVGSLQSRQLFVGIDCKQ